MKKIFLRFVSVILSVMIIITTFSIIPTFAAETEVAVVGVDDSGATGLKELDESEISEDIDYIGSIEDYYKVLSKETGKSTSDLENTLNLSAIDEVDNSSVDENGNGNGNYFPRIGNQNLGSCTAWACCYYQFTYEMNRKMQRTINPENYESVAFSPLWVYNAINDGEDDGSNELDAFNFMKIQGCVSRKEVPCSMDYKTWSPSEEIWTKSLDYRLKDYNYISIGDDDDPTPVNEGTDDKDIQAIKAALANGEVLTFSTYVKSWRSRSMPENSDFTQNEKYKDDSVVIYMIGDNGSHRMTIVGYDDNIWTDVNCNGNVDNGEMGAFKIANSWGADWLNEGFAWVAYDALNEVSAVSGVENDDRRNKIFRNIARITVRDYNSDSNINLVYTLNSSARAETDITIKADNHEGRIAPYSVLEINDICNGFSYDGKEAANDGTMVYALDNVVSNLTSENFKDYNWSVTVKDDKDNENILTVKDLRIVDNNTNTVYVPVETFPQELNGDSKTYTFVESNVATVYYRGYYNPGINYKINYGVSKSFSYAQMTDDYSMQGYTQKFQIYLHDGAKTANVAFTDGNGNWDNNDGNYYTVRAGSNYFITENPGITELSIDSSANNFDTPVNINIPYTYKFSGIGGYGDYKYEYKIYCLSSNENNSSVHYRGNNCGLTFYEPGTYNLCVTVCDYIDSIAQENFIIEVVDNNVEVASFEASEAYTDKVMTFTAKTQYEAVSSNNTYSMEIKKNGTIVANPTVTRTKSDTISKYTELSASWTPTEPGDYTATISVTDTKGIPSTKTIDFSVEASALALDVTSTSTTGSVNINTQQIFNLKRTGGYGPYTYTCVCVNTKTGKFDATVGKLSSGYSVYFRSVGTHKLVFTVTDSKGNKATTSCTVVVEDNNVKFNTFTATNNYVNKPMSFKATTLYEAMSYPIANSVTLTIKKDGVVVATPTVKCSRNISQLTSTFTASYTPITSGYYSATIAVKDYAGRTATKTINFNATLGINYASNNFTTPVNINTAQTYKFDTIGGYGPYTYTYTCYNMTKSTYDASVYPNSTGCTIYYRSEGRHILTVKTTDSKGNTKSYYFYPTAEDNHVELTSFNSTVGYVGGEITFTATTIYEAMLYQIKNNATLTIKKNGVVVATPTVSIKSKNMNTLCSTYTTTWKPTVAGDDYTATLVVTDYYGRKAEKTISFSVNTSLFINNFNISPSTNLGRFENVTMKATAKGGAAGYQYKYSYKQYGEEYVISDYSYQSSFTYQFTKVGPYQLFVTVMDCHGNTATTSKTISINQTGVTGLTADIDNAKKGDTIKITPTVVNEPSVITSENYTYTVTKDNVIQEFKASSDKTFKWVPTEAGDYTIGLNITYNDTLIASKLMYYTVDEKYEYPITIYYTGYDTPYINYQIGVEDWKSDYGHAMTSTDEMEGYTHKYTIEMGSDAKYASVYFTDGKVDINNTNEKIYTVEYGKFYKYENGTLTPYYPSKTIKYFNVTTDDGVFSVGDTIKLNIEWMNSSENYEVRYSYIDSNGEETFFNGYQFIPNLKSYNGYISKPGEYKIVATIRTSSYDYDWVCAEKTITVVE